MRRTINLHQHCSSPYSFCMTATERYFRKMGTRLRVRALPFERSSLPSTSWSCALIATPKREWLNHGRVSDEFAIVEAWSSRPHPTLRASLRFEPLPPGTLLNLTGWYEAPSSLLGAVSDRLTGAWIVTTSMQTFLEDLAISIELQFEQFCAGVDMAHAVASIVARASCLERAPAATRPVEHFPSEMRPLTALNCLAVGG